MRARKDHRIGHLEIRAVYSIAALAMAANVTTDTLRRILRANGITFIQGGRALLVPLSEIERKIPPLWEALMAAERLRRSAEARPARPDVPPSQKP